MKALVLAAGLGTRLKPFTDTHPKCLAEVGGMPLLEIALRRLARLGVRAAVVNAHHHADQVDAFLRAKGPELGLRVEVSFEDPVLETGGGLKKAAPLLRGEGPVLVMNSDVVTDLDLSALVAAHRGSGALATLAVLDRDSARKLLFAGGRLVGRRSTAGDEWAGEPVPGARAFAFSGVHVCEERFLDLMTETGAFSLLKPWLRLAGAGERLAPFAHDGGLWADIGDPDKLERARALVAGRGLPI